MSVTYWKPASNSCMRALRHQIKTHSVETGEKDRPTSRGEIGEGVTRYQSQERVPHMQFIIRRRGRGTVETPSPLLMSGYGSSAREQEPRKNRT